MRMTFASVLDVLAAPVNRSGSVTDPIDAIMFGCAGMAFAGIMASVYIRQLRGKVSRPTSIVVSMKIFRRSPRMSLAVLAIIFCAGALAVIQGLVQLIRG